MLAITHNIKSTQLPLTLLMKVKNDYSHYWISELFELNSHGESNYYITLENADKKITLRSSDNNWEVFSKTNKEYIVQPLSIRPCHWTGPFLFAPPHPLTVPSPPHSSRPTFDNTAVSLVAGKCEQNPIPT